MLKVISSYDEFEGYKDRWVSALSKAGIDNIFLTHEWISAYIKHFFKNKELLILIVFNGEDIGGIAPLMIRRHRCKGLPARTVCFIGVEASDRMDFILCGDKESALRMMLGYLMEIKDKWDFIDLEELTVCSESVKVINDYLAKNRITHLAGPLRKAFFIEFNGKREFIFNRFSKRFDRRLRKLRNRLPDLKLEVKRYIGEKMESEKLFSEVSRIEGLSWKGRKGIGIFSDPESRNFHREVLHELTEKGRVDISILSANEIPIAYIYNYLSGNMVYSYNMAFDSRYSNISPGTVLILWSLKDSAAREISEFDFLRGDDLWKFAFTSDFRPHNRIRIFKNTVYSRFLYLRQFISLNYGHDKNKIYRAWLKLKGVLRWI